MSTFSQVKEQQRPPGRTLILDPWVFADEWESKPREAVCVGLRLMSEADKSKARGEAEKLADELHKERNLNWLDAFNDCLIRQVAALGICSPNDVTKPFDLMTFAEEQVRFALTSRGAAFIFEAIQRYDIESSPLSPEITDEEIAELSGLLGSVCSDSFTPDERRLLGHVLELVRDAVDDDAQ